MIGFAAAFDHLESCDECSRHELGLCAEGRRLFALANKNLHEKTEPEVPETTNRA